MSPQNERMQEVFVLHRNDTPVRDPEEWVREVIALMYNANARCERMLRNGHKLHVLRCEA